MVEDDVEDGEGDDYEDDDEYVKVDDDVEDDEEDEDAQAAKVDDAADDYENYDMVLLPCFGIYGRGLGFSKALRAGWNNRQHPPAHLRHTATFQALEAPFRDQTPKPTATAAATPAAATCGYCC